ncbi:MAG TPA: U32 family peptidase [Actinophytocola sp.]|uniref:U32 family peptidase n=1 Tax=Actinophytocola sp. TaxID=1872138 RepID=UPI002DDDB841|nr:U32 family peptidase [Actinophytocola sp.]HEV2784587.1 U32 family peptidase [Actinophytocola sp.]
MTGPSTSAALLTGLGLPASPALPALPPSPRRFPDGAHYRVEIPSVEGPRCLEAVLTEAERLDVPVTRVSQGTGVGLLTDAEIGEMVKLAAGRDVELSLFARPCAAWGTSAAARSPAGAVLSASAWGQDQLTAAVDEIRRAADLGVRSVLVSDLGVLSVLGRLRSAGELPADLQAKVSVMLPVANPATAGVLVGLGADTLNLPTDLSLAQIAEIRSVVDVPLDIYVEAPDNLGGFVRHHELPRLVEIAPPVYVKFGLRNAPDVYPSGTHLDELTVGLSRERVRRARLGLDLLERSGATAVCSPPGARGLALPLP